MCIVFAAGTNGNTKRRSVRSPLGRDVKRGPGQ